MISDYSLRASGQEMIEHQFPTSIPTHDELRLANAQRGGQEREFPDNEQLLRSLSDMLPMMIWMTGPDKSCVYANQRWLEFTGRPLEAELGRGWMEGVHPEDSRRSWDTSSKAFDLHEPFEIEFRFLRHDGEYRWLSSSGVPRFNARGSFLGYMGSTIDITERKLAEQSLSKVGKAWIEGWEDERANIAQELHHYIDALTVLAISLGRGQNPPASLAKAWETIGKAKQQAEDIVSDVWTLLRRLHSAKLDYLGLEAAAASFCKEFSGAKNVNVTFHGEGIPKDLSKEISLCLYRVLQEALQNATKHSKSQVFEVALTRQSNQIQLTVHDWGVGFDSAPAMKGSGLGLITMRERLKLVDGELVMESQPQQGTTIRARVPYKDG